MLNFTQVLALLREYGPLVLIVAFFLWQGWVREKNLLARICKLEDEQRKVLLPLVARCTKAIVKNTVIMRRLESALDQRWACKANCPHSGESS